MHHRASHVAESKSLHDTSFAGFWAFRLMSDKAQAGAVGQDEQVNARFVWRHVEPGGQLSGITGHQITVNNVPAMLRGGSGPYAVANVRGRRRKDSRHHHQAERARSRWAEEVE